MLNEETSELIKKFNKTKKLFKESKEKHVPIELPIYYRFEGYWVIAKEVKGLISQILLILRGDIRGRWKDGDMIESRHWGIMLRQEEQRKENVNWYNLQREIDMVVYRFRNN